MSRSEPSLRGLPYDAVVVVSFGGPEAPEEVMPFLRNVTRGRNVPEERLAVVAEHYHARGGVSPINQQNRELVDALRAALERAGLALPVYWGNRNWHPLLAETVAEMRDAGVRRALAFVTSAFGSYSGCRQYGEDIARAQAQVRATAGGEAGDAAGRSRIHAPPSRPSGRPDSEAGDRAGVEAGSEAGGKGGGAVPVIHKLRLYFDHPGFIEPMAAGVRAALGRLAAGGDGGPARLVFSAHSIPTAMAAGAPYERQLRSAAALLAARVPQGTRPGEASGWDLVYQSRSGPPQVPWLEPDVVDHLGALHEQGISDVVLVPLGFVSDHMEVIHDLDDEAAGAAAALGMRLERSSTVGTDPTFVDMIVELIRERLDPATPRRSLDAAGPSPNFCPPDCCPTGR